MADMTTQRTVWLAGATGLVGREALTVLLDDPAVSKVAAFTRRPIGGMDERLEEHSVDFDRLEDELAGGETDVGICCLGTTIKKAGSQQAFRRVDYDYVLAFARACLNAGARHFLVVTAMGANPRSRIFYNRVKGEVERSLSSMPWPALTIVRPSLLLGEREEQRPGERIAAPLSRLLPPRYRGIHARTVARAMAELVRQEAEGRRVVLSNELQRLGGA